MAQTDSYNWGYDPFHHGTGRILRHRSGRHGAYKEFRTAIQAIKQDLGMNVIMDVDVVYNHTNAAGPTDRTGTGCDRPGTTSV